MKGRAGSAVHRDWYAWLIDPLTPREFERDYYERRWIHIRRGSAPYYAEILSVADLDGVLGAHSARYPDISLVGGDEDLPASEYTNDHGRILPLEVARGFDEGSTVIFRQLQTRVPSLARLCAELGRTFSSRVQANVYLTPPDAQGFAPHWDTHDVFVLQVSGTKRWSIYDTPVTLPLRGQRFEPGTEPGELSEEFDLGPGSCVYLPRGLMHSARSTGEPSLHVTVGLIAFTWAEFLVESVSAVALEEESLRRSLPRGFALGEIPEGELNRLLRQKIETVQSRLQPDVLWRRFAEGALDASAPLFTDLFGQRLHDRPLTTTSLVRRRTGLLMHATTAEKNCRLRFCGRELDFPEVAGPAVDFVSKVQEFAVGQLPGGLNAHGKVTLVKRLIREGVLQRVSS